MADSIVTCKELLSKLAEGGEFDFLREALLSVLREIVEIEVETKTGASHGERSPERLCRRNGYRVGSLLLSIPKLREGSHFPSYLGPRRRGEQALSSRSSPKPAWRAFPPVRWRTWWWLRGSTASPRARSPTYAAASAPQVEAFRMRPLAGRAPYLWPDATYEKVRNESGRVVSMALVVAYGVAETSEHKMVLAPDDGVRALACAVSEPDPRVKSHGGCRDGIAWAGGC